MNFPGGRRPFGILVWLVAFSSAAESEAAFEFGGRLGYGIPGGKAAGDRGDLQDFVVSQIVIWLDVGARVVDRRLFVGGYLRSGVGYLGDRWQHACDAHAVIATSWGIEQTCDAGSLGFGLEALGHFGMRGQVDPWAGLSFGLANLHLVDSLSTSSDEIGLETEFRGFELLGLQFGADLPLTRKAKALMGPFAAFTLGQYTSVVTDCTDCGAYRGDAQDIGDKALHYWIFLGARITILP